MARPVGHSRGRTTSDGRRMCMSSWRKKLFWVIILALLVLSIVFWGTLAGGVFVITLIQSFQVRLFSNYASSDLAKTFEKEGKNVKGWR